MAGDSLLTAPVASTHTHEPRCIQRATHSGRLRAPSLCAMDYTLVATARPKLVRHGLHTRGDCAPQAGTPWITHSAQSTGAQGACAPQACTPWIAHSSVHTSMEKIKKLTVVCVASLPLLPISYLYIIYIYIYIYSAYIFFQRPRKSRV